jgi:hypothetical protein
MYAVNQPTMHKTAEHQSIIRLTRLDVWHLAGSFGSQARLLI